MRTRWSVAVAVSVSVSVRLAVCSALSLGILGCGVEEPGDDASVNIIESDLVSPGSLDGFLYQSPCADGGTSFDCMSGGCTASGTPKTVERRFRVTGGVAGAVYNVTFRVRGVVEAKNYSGGVRRAGTFMNDSATGGDFWHAGGTVPRSSYNSYELHVSPAVAGAANVYYFNSRNGSSEAHQTWALNYTATVPVMNGGTLRFRTTDSNCRQMMNCGSGWGSSSSSCSDARILDLSRSRPLPPSTFRQPMMSNTQGAPGQWLFIDVLSTVRR